MGWFKKKQERRNPCKVAMHYDDLAGERFEKEIVIPDGYTFELGFAEHPRLLNRNGEVAWVCDRKAGYEVTYEFFYD